MSLKKQIKYTIQASSPEAHIFTVNCFIPLPDPNGQLVSLPAWIPGSYMIRDFAKNIISLSAKTISSKTLSVSREDKSTWKIEACNEEVQITYEVYAWDLSVRTAHLDTTHAFFNGSSVFIEVNGQSDSPCSVEILCPEGSQYKQWRVATSMSRKTSELYGFGEYKANNYDELIDHPVEIGNFTLATFKAAGVPHDIVITGHHKTNMDRLCDDLKKICETHINMFGDLPPIERYVFLVMAVGNGYGGLEHRSSTSLLCSRNDLALGNQEKIPEAYRSFLGLCSHEYFHTWNIKRIKPKVFTPYNLSKESHTRQLWAFEGITSYYDDLCLIRSGLIDENSYMELLGQTATRVWRGKGRHKQSVTDSSFDAWSKFYKQDENAPNAIVSYYTKGALIALALDMTLRKHSDNQKNLDDLMHLLWQNYGKKAIGLEETEIEQLASKLIDYDLTEFFQKYLYSTEDIPLADLLSIMGVDFTLRIASDSNDNGGKQLTDEQGNNLPIVSLGARLIDENSSVKITHVFDGGSVMLAGLSTGDIIIAADGLKVNKAGLEQMIASSSIGDKIQLHTFRRDELMKFELILQAAEKDTCVFTLSAKSNEEKDRLRASWLHKD